jgi:hypothetical protein
MISLEKLNELRSRLDEVTLRFKPSIINCGIEEKSLTSKYFKSKDEKLNLTSDSIKFI